VKDKDKPSIVPATKRLLDMGFDVCATPGTAAYLRNQNLNVRAINKVHQGSPHIVEAMQRGEIKLVFNTVAGNKAIGDSFSLRRAALMGQIPYYTTLSGAVAAVDAVGAQAAGELAVAPLQSYFKS
jgi:carbamoyl-phosphate synthase large subunit